MRSFPIALAPAGVVLLALLFAVKTGTAEERAAPDGQAIWRSCSSCHCVPDPRIAADEEWIALNRTTTCMSGDNDTPEARKALIAYLRAEGTLRPMLIDAKHAAPAGMDCGTIHLPSTAGSAYLKAARKSIREGCPPRIRLHWEATADGSTLAVPVGSYRIVSYAFYRTDKKGRRWTASGSSAEGCASVTVGTETATVDLVPEIRAHLSCTEKDGTFTLAFFMTNRHGQRMSLSRAGTLVNPRWIIRDAKGERIDAGDFEVT